MQELAKMGYCPFCEEEVLVAYKNVITCVIVDNENFEYTETRAFCKNCNEELSPKGLWDFNNDEFDIQYRKIKGLTTIKNLEWLMQTYELGKTTLAQALGLGKVTIARYFAGQIPSKEVSERVHKASSDISYFKKLLIKNKKLLKPATYDKTFNKVNELYEVFSLSEELKYAINYFLNKNRNIGAVQLQKVLYFTECIFGALYNRQIFYEPCQAWTLGPVYPKVYRIFKHYTFEAVGGDDYYLFKTDECNIKEELKNALNLVKESYGIFDGDFLIRLSHKEDPWLYAHADCPDKCRCNEPITFKAISDYYGKVAKKYNLSKSSAILKYIFDVGFDDKRI